MTEAMDDIAQAVLGKGATENGVKRLSQWRLS